MKNSFKLVLVALVLAASFSACGDGDKGKVNSDLKADSLRKDSLAKVASATKKDTVGAKADTSKKDTTKKK
jgi:hypothetical protein